jgi:hypothetical protein
MEEGTGERRHPAGVSKVLSTERDSGLQEGGKRDAHCLAKKRTSDNYKCKRFLLGSSV